MFRRARCCLSVERRPSSPRPGACCCCFWCACCSAEERFHHLPCRVSSDIIIFMQNYSLHNQNHQHTWLEPGCGEWLNIKITKHNFQFGPSVTTVQTNCDQSAEQETGIHHHQLCVNHSDSGSCIFLHQLISFHSGQRVKNKILPFQYTTHCIVSHCKSKYLNI